MGVRAAIDDFGTGYSSLTLLKRLRVDMLKIDQSFVRGAAHTDPDAVILEAIIHIAQGLGMDVMAEGVETVEEMDLILKRGCHLMQGYLFAKPIPREELEATVCSPDAPWRLPIVDTRSWSPRPMGESPATARKATAGDDEGEPPIMRDMPERSPDRDDPDSKTS